LLESQVRDRENRHRRCEPGSSASTASVWPAANATRQQQLAGDGEDEA
jgi:hypothetical protein